MQVWKVNDCDYYAADSFEDAIKCAKEEAFAPENVHFSIGTALKPLPLSEDELRQMQVADADDGVDGPTISGFDHLQRIIASGRTEPVWFACMDW
jgi:hypothetical protein